MSFILTLMVLLHLCLSMVGGGAKLFSLQAELFLVTLGCVEDELGL